MKEILTITAILLTIISYIKYIIDIFKGRTKPHLFSWLAWTILTFIVFFIQLQGGGGVGAFVTLNTGIICFIITIASFKKGEKHIVKTDIIAFIGAILAMILWLFVKQPLMSVILLCIVDMLSFIPTVRKSWNKPQEETLITWIINTVRHSLALFAMETITAVTILSPLYLILANGLFTLMLILRRKVTK